MSSSLGKQAICDQLLVKELGSNTTPVQTINRASTDIFQNDLKFVENASGETRLIIRTDGHLAVSQDVEFYDGTNLATGTKRYSVGLNEARDKFVIRDEVAGVDRLSIDPSGNITGIHQTDVDGLVSALAGKQAALTTASGQDISTTVLDTFALAAGGDGVGYSNSLLTAGAIENWFEQLQNSLIMISPGQTGPGFRVSSISTTLPSSTNVPSCLAVSNFVNTKLTPITVNITNLQSSKLDQSLVTSSMLPSNLSSSSLVTEGGILNFLGSPVLTENGVPIIKSQHKLYARSITETTDSNFSFIKAGVHDVTSGFDATKDNRIATMACTDTHITNKINSLVPTLIGNAQANSTFTGTVTLPDPTNILISVGLGTLTLTNYLTNVVDDHTFTSNVDMTAIILYNNSHLQFPSNVFGLGVLNTTYDAYRPVFCEDVYIGGDSTSIGSSVSSSLNTKVNNPYYGFSIPASVNSTNLGYLANVSSDIQQQFTDVTTSVATLDTNLNASITAVDTNLNASITAVDNGITGKTFNPLKLGSPQSAVTYTNLYGTSNLPNAAIQSNIALNGLNVANAAGDAFNPIFCSELYTGGSSTSVGTSLTAQLAGKVNTADTTTSVTQHEPKLVTSGAVYDYVALELTPIDTRIANKHPLTGIDTVPTTNSDNFVTSGVVCGLFNELLDARTHQTMYPNYLYTQLGTAQIEVWHTWSGLTVVNFASIISGIGINSTNFYKFGADPGAGNFSYHTEYVPSIIFFDNNTPFVLRNLTLNDLFMVRWSFVSYAPYTGNYTFRIGSDGGSRLQIRDSTSSLDNPTTVAVMDRGQQYTTTTGTFFMVAGRLYEYQLFWFENTGTQRCTLEWQKPGDAGFSVFSPTTPCPDFNYFQPQYTVTKSGTGQYTITFGETCLPQSANYTINLSIESITTGNAAGTHLDDYMYAYHSKSKTGFGVYIKEQDDGGGNGTFRDARFDFMCVSRGRIFCHGSVDGFTGTADVEYN